MPDVIVSCSPGFEDLALNEIERVHHSHLSHHALAPGVLLVTSPIDFAAFARPWRDSLPIYLHHIFPVDRQVNLDGTRADLAVLVDALTACIDLSQPAAIQARLIADEHGDRLPDAPQTRDDLPYSGRHIVRVLRDALPDLRLDRGAEQVVSLLIAPSLTAYVGTSQAAQNISAHPGGRLPVRMKLPSRSGKKLVEALDAFDLRLTPGMEALDLGAAPGGWTQVLREHGLKVVAVDKAEMDPRLTADPLVQWERLGAEDFATYSPGPFDLIVNDIIIDAQDSARLMVDYAPTLKAGGAAIMTLKLRSHNRRRVMDHSFRLLRQAYIISRVRQLYYNRHEVTLLLHKMV